MHTVTDKSNSFFHQLRRTSFRLVNDLLAEELRMYQRRFIFKSHLLFSILFSIIPLRAKVGIVSMGIILHRVDRLLLIQEEGDSGETLLFTTTA